MTVPRGARRAPRLGPGTLLAPHFTRRGPFVRIDPLRARPLPGLARIIGAAGWAGLLAYAGWQAYRREWVTGAGRAAFGSRPGDVPDSS